MKVVHVINNLSMGGAEMLMTTLLPQQKQMGIETELICLNSISQPSYLKELEKSNIRVHFLSKNTTLYSPTHISGITKLIRHLQPDLVHAHLFPTFYWVGLAKFIFNFKIPFIITEHGTSNRRIETFWLKPLENFIYKQYRHIVCISEGVLRVMQKYTPCIPATRIYNGINLSKFENPNPVCSSRSLLTQIQTIKKQADAKIILTVGRLVSKKNHITMIKIMASLPRNYYLLICGEGDMRSLLEQEISYRQLESNVILLGNQTDIPYLIKNAHLGLLTSTTEGFGLAVVEMMAGGLPVVSSNVPGLNELAADELLLADPLDAERFASIIQHLLTHTDLYNSIKQKSIQKAQEFSILNMASNYLHLYKKIIA